MNANIIKIQDHFYVTTLIEHSLNEVNFLKKYAIKY